MRRKPKDEFLAKAAELPDNGPDFLDVGQVYIHPVVGPVRCQEHYMHKKGLTAVPAALLIELYPEPGRSPQQIQMPQKEVKDSHIRTPSSQKDMIDAFNRLTHANGQPPSYEVRSKFGAMLLSNDLHKLTDLIAATVGRDSSTVGPSRKPSDADIAIGERAMLFLARECALVMKYNDVAPAIGMVRDALKAGALNRGSNAPGGYGMSKP